MASLFNQQISQTYQGLLKTSGNGVLTSSLAQITDGSGNGSKLYLSTTTINFYNAYSFPSTDGSANQVLKTDGSGALTWEDDANTGGVTKTGTIALNTIAVWNDNVDQLRSDTTMSINTNHTISLLQPNSVPTDVSSYNIGGGNIANVTGQNNVGFGQANMQRVTTGGNNVAFGNSTLDKLTTGSNNTTIGNLGLFSLTEGDGNTSVGEGSLDDVTTGSNNTAIGKDSGSAITTGSKNVILGSFTGNSGGTDIRTSSNNIIISDGDGNNRIQVDSSGNVGIGVSPTAFRTNDRQLQIKDATSLFQLDGISSSYLAWNAYFDGSWKRHKSGYVNMLRLNNDNNGISFYQSGTGSANSAISFTEPLTISSGGDVGIGTSSPTSKLNVVDSANGAAIKVSGAVTDTSASYYGFMHDGTDLQGTTQVNMFYSGGAIKASTTIAEFASFRIDAPSLSASGSAITNSYGIYQASSAQKNYFGGNVDIGGNLSARRGSFGTASNFNFDLYNNGTSYFNGPVTIDDNVGIRTSSPDDVNGTSLSSHTNLQVFSTSNAAHLIVNGGVNGSLLLNDSGASANSRLWRVMSDGGVFSINALTDATAAKHNTLEISEGGTVAIYGAASSSHQFLIHGFDNGTNFNTFSQNLSDQELFGVRNNGEFQTGQATNSPANNSTTGSGNCFINSAGTLVTTSSSKKFKNTITDATHGLSDVLKLRSVTYKSNNTKIDGDKTFGGFIAEEVNDIGLTEFVHYDDDDEPKSLHYANMVSLLTKAIQEQQTIIEDLKARIEKLEL